MIITNTAVNLVVIVILCYLAGSIPTSIIAARLLKGIDIRNYGSGNAGGTNSFRVLGWKAGIIVVIIDIFKGFASVTWISSIRILEPSSDIGALAPVLAGSAAIFGHCYTVFAKFKGGKGVATSAGMLIALSPVSFLICLTVFLLVLFTTGYVSLGSVLTAAVFPVTLIILHTISPGSISFPFLIFSFAAAAFILYSHRSNIKRLIQGKENRFNKVRIFAKK